MVRIGGTVIHPNRTRRYDPPMAAQIFELAGSLWKPSPDFQSGALLYQP